MQGRSDDEDNLPSNVDNVQDNFQSNLPQFSLVADSHLHKNLSQMSRFEPVYRLAELMMNDDFLRSVSIIKHVVDDIL